MIEKWLWIKLKTTWNIREQIEKEKLKIRDQTKKQIKIKDQKILFTYFFLYDFWYTYSKSQYTCKIWLYNIRCLVKKFHINSLSKWNPYKNKTKHMIELQILS